MGTVQGMVATLFRIIFDEVISAVVEHGKSDGKKIGNSINDVRGSITKKGLEIKGDTTQKLRSSPEAKSSKTVDKLKGILRKQKIRHADGDAQK